eukprot:362783-Chlamydomonas_euryale.AAC.20
MRKQGSGWCNLRAWVEENSWPAGLTRVVCNQSHPPPSARRVTTRTSSRPLITKKMILCKRATRVESWMAFRHQALACTPIPGGGLDRRGVPRMVAHRTHRICHLRSEGKPAMGDAQNI